jgi:hypothetical protein
MKRDPRNDPRQGDIVNPPGCGRWFVRHRVRDELGGELVLVEYEDDGGGKTWMPLSTFINNANAKWYG